MAKLTIYNLAEVGVNIDSDSVHAPRGGFRQAQNIHRNPTIGAQESVITRLGLRNFNSIAMGAGPVLGGVAIPVFELGDGEATLFIGFGD